MAERNDPRINRLYWDGYSWEHLYADDLSLFENGVSNPGVYSYSYTAYMFAQTADTYMMSYREFAMGLGRSAVKDPAVLRRINTIGKAKWAAILLEAGKGMERKSNFDL